MSAAAALPDAAEIVVIGGGIVGCSIAYNLVKRMGAKDVLVLEKSGLTHGATWHAAGLVGQLRSNRNKTRLMQRSVALYDQLEAETGQAVDWKKVGSLRLACSDERMLDLKRTATMAKSFGLDMELVGPGQARELFPLMAVDDLVGAAFIPGDGFADPASLTQALAKGARDGGARIAIGVEVTGFESAGRRIVSVVTEQGKVKVDKVVNAGGIWARDLSATIGVAVPVIALEHQYLLTEPLPDMPAGLPGVRDPDHRIYIKPEVRGVAVGGWEAGTKPWRIGDVPRDFGPELLPGDMARFEPLAEAAIKRVPAIGEVGVRELINGPIPWSADDEFILGRASELDNYYLATGISYGIAAAGGIGEVMAHWIVEEAPDMDLFGFDIRRFAPHHNDAQFLAARCVELYGKYYALRPPEEEHGSARRVYLSPLYERLAAKGAAFGSRQGWERANWFAGEGCEALDRPAFKQPNWFDAVGVEHCAVRQAAGLIDMTSFSKFTLDGPGALAVLQRLCTANIARSHGTAIYTQMCNDTGGIEADLTVTRLGPDKFYIVTGSAFGGHDGDWIRRHLPGGGSVTFEEVTQARAVLNLCGPNARAILGRVTDDDLSDNALPFAAARSLTLAGVAALAIRISYMGELGYELHLAAGDAGRLYDALMQAGEEEGLRDVGYRAVTSLRLEKGYVYWGADVTPDDNPYEAGLGGRVAFKKGPFIGREALLAVKQKGPARRLATFTCAPEAWLHGGECILHAGRVIDVTTSGGFGHTIGRAIALGYVPVDLAAETSGFEIEAFGERFPAEISFTALYDPEMRRMKG